MKAGFLLCVTLLFGIFSCNNHPSEKKLEQNFSEYKQEFDHLLKMINEDVGIRRLSKDNIFYTEHGPTISEERTTEYREIFKRLQINYGFSRYNTKTVAFIVSSGDNKIFDRSYKAYLYSTETKEPIVNSIDEAVHKGNNGPVYKKLDENWYLVYETW